MPSISAACADVQNSLIGRPEIAESSADFRAFSMALQAALSKSRSWQELHSIYGIVGTTYCPIFSPSITSEPVLERNIPFLHSLHLVFMMLFQFFEAVNNEEPGVGVYVKMGVDVMFFVSNDLVNIEHGSWPVFGIDRDIEIA